MGSKFKISDFCAFNLSWNLTHQNSTPIIKFYNLFPDNLSKLRGTKYVSPA
jgi:hypothetical protein